MTIKVEQYGSQRFQSGVTRSPLAPRMQTGSRGAAIATGLDAASKAVNFIADDISTTEAEDTLVKFEREGNKLLHSPESGYLNTKGKNAYELGTDASDRITKLQQTYSEGLSGDAKSKFNRVADSMTTRNIGTVQKHAAGGFNDWKISTIKDTVENSIENVGLNWNDAEEVGVQLELGRAAVRDAANLEGVDPKERVQNFDAAAAKAAIQSATAVSADEGKKALESYGDLLEGNNRNLMKEKIETKSRQEEQRDQAIQSVAIANNMLTQYESLTDMQQAVRTEYKSDPELMGKALRELQTQYSQQKVAEKDEQADTFNAAQDFLRTGGTSSSYIAINPQGWDSLSAVQKASLEKQDKGVEVKTDWNKYNDWSLMQPNELAAVDPNDYQPFMAPTELKAFNSALKSARRGEKTPEHQVGRTRATQTTSAMVQLIRKDKKDWSREDMKKADAAYDMLNDMVVYRETQLGRKLTPDEYTAALSDLTYRIVKERPWYRPDTETGLADDILGLSESDRMILTNKLRKDNLPVTAENLMRLYDQVRKE